MKTNSRSKVLIVLLIFMILIFITSIGYMVYDKFIKKDNDNSDKTEVIDKTSNRLLASIFDDEYYKITDKFIEQMNDDIWNDYDNVLDEVIDPYIALNFLNFTDYTYEYSTDDNDIELKAKLYSKESTSLTDISYNNRIMSIISLIGAFDYKADTSNTCKNAYSKPSKTVLTIDKYKDFETCSSIKKEAFDYVALKVYNETLELTDSLAGMIGGNAYLIEYNSSNKEYNVYLHYVKDYKPNNKIYTNILKSNTYDDRIELYVNEFVIYADFNNNSNSTYYLYTNTKNNKGTEIANVLVNVTPSLETKYIDIKGRTVEKIFKKFSDKLSTYKYTFKKVNDNYIFEKIELVK